MLPRIPHPAWRRPAILAALVLAVYASPLRAQDGSPALNDSKLALSPVVTGLTTPTTLAFLGPDDFFVLEKMTGQVKRVTAGVVTGTVLDLAVNNASERGLLGIALHPDFEDNGWVYLFWTCRTAGASTDPFVPDDSTCAEAPGLGEDTDVISAVPLLGNRVDRFHWDGSALTWDRNLITLRAFQADGAPTPPNQGDEEQVARGNHDGGILRFGPDGKLYVMFGDQGRRGQLQNLEFGPTDRVPPPDSTDDDQFGGPEPDDAHLAGVILRLNDDGSIPTDNPFYAHGASLGTDVGVNLQKVFAYGIRNSFGMAFDPMGGTLWMQDNGEDAFDELTQVTAGMNSGWIQFAGPADRIDEFKEIESTSLHGGETFPNLQQLRWGPERIADTPEEAMERLFEVPGSQYRDPDFAWKYVIAPAAIGFVEGRALGPRYDGDLLMGLSTPVLQGGPLLRFELKKSQRTLTFRDGRLDDGVADNEEEEPLLESESLVLGTGFGVVTDIQTRPDESGVLVVSLSEGTVWELSEAPKGNRPAAVDGNPARLRLAARNLGRTTVAGPHASGAAEARVDFDLAEPVRLDAGVYDVQGRLVRGLARGQSFAAGSGSVTWDGRTEGGTVAPPGAYFVRLVAGPDQAVARLLWLR
jgi:glucose/arabinose dehydrogenase